MVTRADAEEFWSILLHLMIKQVNLDLPFANYADFQGEEAGLHTISLAGDVLKGNCLEGFHPGNSDPLFDLGWTFTNKFNTLYDQQVKPLADRILRLLTVEHQRHLQATCNRMEQLLRGPKPLKGSRR